MVLWPACHREKLVGRELNLHAGSSLSISTSSSDTPASLCILMHGPASPRHASTSDGSWPLVHVAVARLALIVASRSERLTILIPSALAFFASSLLHAFLNTSLRSTVFQWAISSKPQATGTGIFAAAAFATKAAAGAKGGCHCVSFVTVLQSKFNLFPG